MIYTPIALCAPLYLQNVLGASALAAGLILAILPLSTALASPLSGRLADRFDAAVISAIGLGAIVAGIAGYSRLNSESHLLTVGMVLALLGGGVGFFTPANQKIAFAAIDPEDYGVLAAMLSSFGTAAGRDWHHAYRCAYGIRRWSRIFGRNRQSLPMLNGFAFACLVPVGLLAIWVWKRTARDAARAIALGKITSCQIISD